MRIFIATALILAATAFAQAECTTEMQAFNNHQNVIKGMMDMNFQGKLNSQNSKAIGERLKKGQKASENGDYAKACDIYDSIIEDYGMEKVFGVQPEGGQDKKKGEKQAEPATSESSATATSAEDASAGPPGE